MSVDRLTNMLRRHEGVKPHAYQDSKGIWTIGCGRNIDKERGGPGLSNDEIDMLLENDIINHRKQLATTFSWFNDLDEVRQDALIDMHFMGHGSFCTFKNMIAALEAGNYKKAHDEALNSKWAKQDVGEHRSKEIAMMLWRGEYAPDAT